MAILCFDGVDELDVFGPYRVFVGARDAGADIVVSLVTVAAADSIETSHGVTVGVDDTISRVDPDLVVVPGGGWNARAPQSAWGESERGDIPELLTRLHENDVLLAGVCTGTMLLATAGLVTGRPAVTHAGALDDLRAAGADVKTARVVDDGDIVTAGGVTSGIDLALHILDREFSPDLAASVEQAIEYHRV